MDSFCSEWALRLGTRILRLPAGSLPSCGVFRIHEQRPLPFHSITVPPGTRIRETIPIENKIYI